MIRKIIQILLAPLVWLVYAISLRYFLWPFLENYTGHDEVITWARAGLVLLLVFVATLLTLVTLALPKKKAKDLDEPHVFRRDDIKPGSEEASQTIDVVAKRPDLEKID